MSENEMQQDMSSQVIPTPQGIAVVPNGEFLRYLLDQRDPIEEVQNELEGKEYVYNKEGKPELKSVRPPLVNSSLRNKIVGLLKTYSQKGFITTNLLPEEINYVVYDVADATIDLILGSLRYSSMKWNENQVYKDDYPAFMYGCEQQILLLIEHSVLATLKRSQNAITLNKVTGMHQSVETRSLMDQQKKKGWLSNWGAFK